jgi:hypothetical protein
MLSLLKSARAPVVQFLCDPENNGLLAEPVPAKAYLPDWFKKLPAIDAAGVSASNSGLTVKRCMPFLDAMTLGWVLPLAATVRLEIRDNGETVNAGWDFDRTMVSNHSGAQVAGHPRLPTPPCKFHNFWTVVTPKGWSTLFMPPLNRPNPVFEVASGVVDTDSYTAPVHFPFFATAPDGVYVIEKGTPLVQIVPFNRSQSAYGLQADIRAATSLETQQHTMVTRATKVADGWYRTQARAPR